MRSQAAEQWLLLAIFVLVPLFNLVVRWLRARAERQRPDVSVEPGPPMEPPPERVPRPGRMPSPARPSTERVPPAARRPAEAPPRRLPVEVVLARQPRPAPPAPLPPAPEAPRRPVRPAAAPPVPRLPAAVFRDRRDLRRAIVLMAILGTPRGLQAEERDAPPG
jgi:hypothetical protein